MKPRAWIIRAIALLTLLACRPETTQACAVCFGKSDSKLAVGMNWGIFTLLFCIVSVLAGLSCFFVFLAVRSSRHPQNGPIEGSSDSPQNLAS